MMNLSSSVNLKLLQKKYEPTINPNGGIATVQPSINSYWVIQTKFETPSINFADVSLDDNFGLRYLGGTGVNNANPSDVYEYLYKGIWTSYGKPATEDSGIELKIQNSENTSDANHFN